MKTLDFESPASIVSIAELERGIGGGAMGPVWVEGTNPDTGYHYDLTFVPRDESSERARPAYIRVKSEAREDFLERGDEQAAQDDLVDVSKAVRGVSRGAFDILPFDGAVFGTKLTPIIPNWNASRGDEDTLSTIINLGTPGNDNSKIAAANNVTRQWLAEYARYNRGHIFHLGRTGMEMAEYGDVARLLSKIGERSILEDIAVTRAF